MSDKRLIDANALHKRIEMNLRASNPFTIEECCYKDALNSVDEAPTIAPETIRPQWIDVQDKLPEEYQSVLGVANGVDVRIVHYALGGFWMEDTTGEEYNVTYWMPLPEIPKEN